MKLLKFFKNIMKFLKSPQNSPGSRLSPKTSTRGATWSVVWWNEWRETYRGFCRLWGRSRVPWWVQVHRWGSAAAWCRRPSCHLRHLLRLRSWWCSRARHRRDRRSGPSTRDVGCTPRRSTPWLGGKIWKMFQFFEFFGTKIFSCWRNALRRPVKGSCECKEVKHWCKHLPLKKSKRIFKKLKREILEKNSVEIYL